MKKTKLYAIHCTLYAITAGHLLVFAAGCEDANRKTSEINTLRLEKMQLTHQIKQSGSEIKQLKNQIQVLSGLESDIRLENLYHLKKVKITRYTNLYDKDKDGKSEQLIVYIQPIDEVGDLIKAAGTVDVQLWDLNRKDGKTLLGQWHVEPDELKKLWFASIVLINYRLTFDVTDIIENYETPLTVKVTFTDYLTGKVFEEQKVIKPR